MSAPPWTQEFCGRSQPDTVFLDQPTSRTETRLLNLERRLEQLNAPIRLGRETRGRVRLEVQARTTLERIADFAA